MNLLFLKKLVAFYYDISDVSLLNRHHGNSKET